MRWREDKTSEIASLGECTAYAGRSNVVGPGDPLVPEGRASGEIGVGG